MMRGPDFTEHCGGRHAGRPWDWTFSSSGTSIDPCSSFHDFRPIGLLHQLLLSSSMIENLEKVDRGLRRTENAS